MKRIIYILVMMLFVHTGYTQDDQNGTARIREKMVSYIQDRLGLSKTEAERFQPVFLDYFRDLKKTNQDFKGDRLLLQQKVIEVRLRYRDQFRPIIGEKRSNDVFLYERDFVNTLKEIRDERMENRGNGLAPRRNHSPL
ncbi:MAG: hypothetical protein ACM3VS_14405 [Candidatus Dadabacteria bacterium]